MALRHALSATVTLTLALTLACGSDSTAPHPATGIAFTAGNQQSDTIGASLVQALTVRIQPPSGQSAAGQIVQFQSVPANDIFFGYEAYVEPLTSPAPMTFIADTTDATGRTRVVVVLGTKAGRARLIVKVPTFGFVDTATFTVKPGAPVSMSPVDTAVLAGATVMLNDRTTDRALNRRADAITYTLLSGPATLSGSNVMMTGPGMAIIQGSVGSLRDTSVVAAVPTATIAASLDDATGFVTFHLDGSALAKVAVAGVGTLKWAPDGQSLVFDQTQGDGTYNAGPLLQSTRLNGQLVTLDNSPQTPDAWPTYTHDGSWIYYEKYYANDPLWRVHPDGSGDAVVPMQNPSGMQFPSVSPDGQHVVYVVPGTGHVNVLDVSTGISTDLGVTGYSTMWSPAGNRIAYVTGSLAMAVVGTDGSDPTIVGKGQYTGQFDWSPDGKWIIARNNGSRKIELINIDARAAVRLSFTGQFASPTWH